ncbi:hypothetical protein [Kitasatospora sp. NPDC002965]|uniref:hypothetical protein n=1 Tax=Kitasatospora sp. NPDC002965 TaxID=3154775 RepID=UPI0033B4B2CA
MLRMNGPLRITVLDKDAAFEQRAVVRTPYGTSVLEGRTGASLDVRAEEWELELEHCVPGVGWRPNVRVLPGPWQTSRSGLRSRILRSKDCDWPNGDPAERNFVLRLSSTVAELRRDASSAAEEVGPATSEGLRTSSGPGLGAGGRSSDSGGAVVGGSWGGYPAGSAERPVVPAVPAESGAVTAQRRAVGAGEPVRPAGEAVRGVAPRGVAPTPAMPLAEGVLVPALRVGSPAGGVLGTAVAVEALRLPAGRGVPAERCTPVGRAEPGEAVRPAVSGGPATSGGPAGLGVPAETAARAGDRRAAVADDGPGEARTAPSWPR